MSNTLTFGGHTVPHYSFNTVVVGSGAAGYNAADRLYQFGQKDIALVTENTNAGTSRNTGSDKQTYYKLTLSGSEPDSVGEMAETLFAGTCMDGDIALAEAALSPRCFLRLVDLGVEFPTNRYGEYIGYKTDHDPRRRATSVGPLTSKRMTEALEASVDEKDLAIFDHYQVISVLTNDNQIEGLLCLKKDEGEEEADKRYAVFSCKNVIYATGGPAGIYADSVFPLGHLGASGIAFEAGVKGKNLTEWQYGLASTQPRWNVSGTYMQVLPRFISTDQEGNDEREFLTDFYADKGELLSMVFLKGYQWPFDVRKIKDGSSMIDLLVYIESKMKNRRVFLDFRSNPFAVEDLDYTALDKEALEYLENAKATFGTPIQRLLHMNSPAVDFYKDKGVDLAKEPLEIALCAQHNNGGLAVDAWWQTNVEGFFAAGEVAGTHGVYRPGGSALNSGQVGSTRAAQFVAQNRTGTAPALSDSSKEKAVQMIELGQNAIKGQSNIAKLRERAQKEMSRVGAAIRNKKDIATYMETVSQQILDFGSLVQIESYRELRHFYRLYDILISQLTYLGSMMDFTQAGGGSRGSALYTDEAGDKPAESLPDIFRFTLDDPARGDQIQEVGYEKAACTYQWRQRRPIPKEDDFFETVWRQYRENKNIF